MTLLLNNLNKKLLSQLNNSSITSHIYNNIKIGDILLVNILNLEKSKLKKDTFSGKVLKLKRNGLLTRFELLIKTSTMSCIKKVYVNSPLITRIELLSKE